MRPHRLLTLGPDHEPLWVRPYVQKIGKNRAAMIASADEAPPHPDQLKGVAFFGETSVEAERQAVEYFEMEVKRDPPS